MKEIVLGPRLQAVSDYVTRGARVADIGTDHGYLPIYLVQSRIIERAVGIDVHEGPYRSALHTVESYELSSVIDIRLGDGLKPLCSGEVDTLILAGMGGSTMLEILGARPEILESVEQVIAQPQGAQARLRRELLTQGFLLLDERMVEDEGRLYTVINFTRHSGKSLQELDQMYHNWLEELKPFADGEELLATTEHYFWLLGPIIIERKDPLLKHYLDEQINVIAQRIEQMQNSLRPEVQTERMKLIAEKQFLEGIKKWLYQSD